MRLVRDSEPEPTPVADGKITLSSTQISGVDVNYTDDILTISIDENIDWTQIEQDPNTNLGANADTLYVGIHLERPTNDITHVMLNAGNGDEVVKLGEHSATTATGRYYYFGVAKKVTDENNTVTWETLTDDNVKVRTVKWYIDEDTLETVEEFNVIRELKTTTP